MSSKSSEITKKDTEDSQDGAAQGSQLTLTKDNVIDLSELGREEIADLKKQYTEGMIDLKKKAEEMQIDENTLNSALSTFVEHTHSAIESGSSLTITHSQTTHTGRTEVVMGNTKKAAKGKISRSAAGEKDRTVWMTSIIAIVSLLIAISLGLLLTLKH